MHFRLFSGIYGLSPQEVISTLHTCSQLSKPTVSPDTALCPLEMGMEWGKSPHLNTTVEMLLLLQSKPQQQMGWEECG